MEFKHCTALIVPTKDVKHPLYRRTDYEISPSSEPVGTLHPGTCKIDSKYHEACHLVIVSNEDRGNVGDYVLNVKDSTVYLAEEESDISKMTLKIVGSSNTAYGVPDISHNFPKEYCKLGGPSDILVAYEGDEVKVFMDGCIKVKCGEYDLGGEDDNDDEEEEVVTPVVKVKSKPGPKPKAKPVSVIQQDNSTVKRDSTNVELATMDIKSLLFMAWRKGSTTGVADDKGEDEELFEEWYDDGSFLPSYYSKKDLMDAFNSFMRTVK